MNPLRSVRNYFIGGILAKTDDVFEQVKAEVLFNFTFIFLLTNLPYLFVAIRSTVLFILGTSTIASLIFVLIILRRNSNVRSATYFFLLNFLLQVGGHYFIDNGDISVQGMLFFLMFSLCGYLLMDRKWGLSISIFIVVFFFVGIYNTNNGNCLFNLPAELADPKEMGAMRYFSIVPIILNIYLISEFVKAKQKAEKQLLKQKKTIEEKQKEIVDSIHYANRIQRTMMPSEKYFDKEMERLQGKN
jgi:hypothetical protein